MSVSVCIPLPADGRYQDQWDYLLDSFRPDALYVIGDEADAPGTNVFAALNATYISDCSELPTDPTFVVFAPENGRFIQGNESIESFIHPTDVIYFFGHDTNWVDSDTLGGETPDHLVFIPTDSDSELWSWQAAAICLWDRRVKHG